MSFVQYPNQQNSVIVQPNKEFAYFKPMVQTSHLRQLNQHYCSPEMIGFWNNNNSPNIAEKNQDFRIYRAPKHNLMPESSFSNRSGFCENNQYSHSSKKVVQTSNISQTPDQDFGADLYEFFPDLQLLSPSKYGYGEKQEWIPRQEKRNFQRNGANYQEYFYYPNMFHPYKNVWPKICIKNSTAQNVNAQKWQTQWQTYLRSQQIKMSMNARNLQINRNEHVSPQNSHILTPQPLKFSMPMENSRSTKKMAMKKPTKNKSIKQNLQNLHMPKPREMVPVKTEETILRKMGIKKSANKCPFVILPHAATVHVPIIDLFKTTASHSIHMNQSKEHFEKNNEKQPCNSKQATLNETPFKIPVKPENKAQPLNFTIEQLIIKNSQKIISNLPYFPLEMPLQNTNNQVQFTACTNGIYTYTLPSFEQMQDLTMKTYPEVVIAVIPEHIVYERLDHILKNTKF